MAFLSIVQELPTRLRRLVAPRYRPEKHYMRGRPSTAQARAANDDVADTGTRSERRRA